MTEPAAAWTCPSPVAHALPDIVRGCCVVGVDEFAVLVLGAVGVTLVVGWWLHGRSSLGCWVGRCQHGRKSSYHAGLFGYSSVTVSLILGWVRLGEVGLVEAA